MKLHQFILRGLTFLCVASAITTEGAEVITIHRSDGAEVRLNVFDPGRRPCPAALISPGANGTEHTLTYLAEALAKKGWLAVIIGHKESGPEALREHMIKYGAHNGLGALAGDAHAYECRAMDLAAALKWRRDQDKASFIALLGHSMGAATVLMEAGAKNKMGVSGSDRFNAYVAISPMGPGSLFPEDAWRGIRKPVLVLTGTLDNGIEGGWKWRTAPYANMPAGSKWLGVIDGASHVNFAGMGEAGRVEALAASTSTEFLDPLSKGKSPVPSHASGITLESK